MNILIVEDDILQADAIEDSLRQNFNQVEVKRISSESEFREKLSSLKTKSLDVILLDVMLRWAEPTPEMKEPPLEVEQQGFYRGGMRCLNLLLASPETRSIPVIVYSVLGRDDVNSEIDQVPPHVLFLQKDSDEQRLVRHIRSLLQGVPEAKTESSSLRERLWESIQAKPGWLGFSLDLKKLLSRKEKRGDG